MERKGLRQLGVLVLGQHYKNANNLDTLPLETQVSLKALPVLGQHYQLVNNPDTLHQKPRSNS